MVYRQGIRVFCRFSSGFTVQGVLSRVYPKALFFEVVIRVPVLALQLYCHV